MTAVLERIASKVKYDNGCQVWTGCLSTDGYGLIKLNGRSQRAHRVAYQAHYGEIPAGLVIDHLCRNRACVNVQHLRVVTRRDNTLAEGSLATSKTHSEKTECVNGHPFSGENLHIDPKRGRRSCKACARRNSMSYYHRTKGQK